MCSAQAAGVLKPRREKESAKEKQQGSRGESRTSVDSGMTSRGSSSLGDSRSKKASRDAQLRSLSDLGNEEEADGNVDDLWSLDTEGQGGEQGGPGHLVSEPEQKRQWGQGLMKKYSQSDFKQTFPDRGS